MYWLIKPISRNGIFQSKNFHFADIQYLDGFEHKKSPQTEAVNKMDSQVLFFERDQIVTKANPKPTCRFH